MSQLSAASLVHLKHLTPKNRLMITGHEPAAGGRAEPCWVIPASDAVFFGNTLAAIVDTLRLTKTI